MTRRLRVVAWVVATVFLVPGVATASWIADGAGSGRARAETAPVGDTPTVNVSGRNAVLSWSAATFGDGTAVDGYEVSRYPADGGAAQPVDATCSGLVTALACTEAAVPPGAWRYAITPHHGSWVGGASAPSAAAVVGAPSFAFASSSTITSLPDVRAGIVANFVTGETVTFHLDGPGGPALAGSTAPAPVPFGGSAVTSTTIPAGMADGVHDVYAVGSLGSEGAAQLTIDTTAPAMAAAAIQKSAGGALGYVRQGGTYYVYARVTDAVSSVASVTANVATVTTGLTATPLTPGSWTVGGVAYNYRSALLTATTPLAAGVKAFSIAATDTVANAGTTSGFSVAIDNTAPTASDIQATNGGATAGRAETGDVVTYTYSEAMDPDAILAGWDGSATSVTVRLVQAGGSDRLEVYDASGTTLLALGSVRLNRTDFVTATVNFTGSTMTQSGAGIQIVLGTPSGATTTAAGADAMRWTSDTAATDLAGNACGGGNHNETGANDLDF